MELEWYRDKSHVVWIGLFKDGALVTWAFLWNGVSKSGRWPRRKQSNPEAKP